MKIWTIGIKVPDIDHEIAFLTRLGGHLLLDDTVRSGNKEYRAPLMRLGDKYMHVLSSTIYEPQLQGPLPYGLAHIVYQVDDIAGARARALDAGATELLPPRRVSAGFGTRDVGCYRSPGGLIFELIQIYENLVPTLP
jgi:catechol 2,3-dioxygenase-like lactoylglutathione lyase family enzyme